MNFLAHAFLSGDNRKILVGNFIADFVKGQNSLAKYDAVIAAGIKLHRSIDAFTDTHAVVHQSKKRLWNKYRHYAAVIVDIYYDHFLAHHWKRFHHQSLEHFASYVYDTVLDHKDVLPISVQTFLPYMIKGNWLLNYASFSGIERTLTGMAKRTSHPSRMEEAIDDLKEHYADFEKEFLLFFPSLVDYIRPYHLNYSE